MAPEIRGVRRGFAPLRIFLSPRSGGQRGVETGCMKQDPSLDSCFRRNDNIWFKDTSQLRDRGVEDKLMRVSAWLSAGRPRVTNGN